MNRVMRLYFANIIIVICVLGAITSMSSIAFDVGVIKGETEKAREINAAYESRDEWLQINTTPMFFSFWLTNREFCKSVGIQSYKSIIEIYQKQPEIDITMLHQRYK